MGIQTFSLTSILSTSSAPDLNGYKDSNIFLTKIVNWFFEMESLGLHPENVQTIMLDSQSGSKYCKLQSIVKHLENHLHIT